ncbi:MAG: serine hydrolase, partial [Gemmatimonadetes bacterium]|nr:beta-lactamase family protein [Gemmatimonadota bacterium]NIQ54517.1 beta-lactamase family protein [Gemmatimonadota bacterium]NIU74719.1 serine hydrolase [Gammaproteobacteria bacterium]NIX44643.1 serine hydrolase [Gemmatimonadota bacterium]NIY08873.1 serine hydrolase [Gemmatimonadota bacterium]
MSRWTMVVTEAALCLALAGSARPLPAQAVIGGEWRADVRRLATGVVDAGLSPGIGVAVAVDDWIAFAEGFGTADLDTGRPVTDDTPFYIASSTKSLTATAAALAAQRGELDLDAPMVRYLPDARLPDGVDRDRIRVRDLLTLTHGLAGSGPIVLRTAFTGEFTRAQLLELLRYHEPTGQHGHFDYNNLGYNLLGMVLESVYDESWKDIVDRLVLRPLGMTSTSAYRSRLDPDRLALPHDFGPDGFAAIPLAKRDENLHAAGGHFASARDLARYLAAHQTGGQLYGQRVLPAEPLAATHRLHVAQDRDFGPFHRHGWGYGWDLGTYDGDTLVHRFGGFPGYRSHMSFMPAHRIGVVVLVNGGGIASPAADLLATYIYDRLLGKDGIEPRYAARLDSLTARAAEARGRTAAHLEERAARMAPLPHPLEDYAGVYASPVLGHIAWRVVAGGLEARIGVLHSRVE